MNELSFDFELTKLTALVTERLENKKENLEEEVREILKELNLLFWVEECGYYEYDNVPFHSHLPEASALQKKLFDFNLHLKDDENFKYNENQYKIVIVCGQIYQVLIHNQNRRSQ